MKFLEWIDEHQEDMIKDLGDLIAIKSDEGTPEADAPFGTGPRDALLKFLEIGKRDGFRTDNLQNYAGDIEFGKGDETVGILAHVDVVPAGSGWETDPYKMENDGQFLQGRGTQDDKGPAIAAYYAMRAIKETGVELKRNVRLILGTNEETHWGGINYYVKNKKMPDFGFTPDANFPVIYGEKGILTGTLKLDVDLSKSVVKSINGGTAPNMVPDACELKLDSSIENAEEFKALESSDDFEFDSEKFILKSKGKSAHGSTPQKGRNAISILMKEVEKLLPEEDEFRKFAKFYNEVIGFNMHGEGMGIDFEDPESGKLNYNIGMISNDEKKIEIVINMRFPLVGVTKEMIIEKIEASSKEFNGVFTRTGGEEPLRVDPNSKLVNIMVDAYREISGDIESKPMTIGGGTYAKAMKNCVAFGSMFPGDEDRMHQKNERIEISQLVKAAKIYAVTLYNFVTEDNIL
ncbi:MAG: dipeptidase PepV [Ezakiella sp.]|nr:dipeptidase PepV [Ezakiella sp.]